MTCRPRTEKEKAREKKFRKLRKGRKKELAYEEIVQGVRTMTNIKGTSQVALKEQAASNAMLRMLDAFELQTRPHVPKRFTGNKKSLITPLVLYNNTINYFRACICEGVPITMSGIASMNGMRKDDFATKRLEKKGDKDWRCLEDLTYFVETYMEFSGQLARNPAFQIFWLKNRNWKDKVDIEAHTTVGALTEEERAEAQKRIANFSEPING